MINAIVAVSKNQGIGIDNQLPWPRLKGDMLWFKNITSGNVIIMGSNTWKSLGCSPLPNRINIVLSKHNHWSEADHTFSDPETALVFCSNEYPDKEIFVIGGSAVYGAYMNKIEKFFITEIDEEYPCDTWLNMDNIRKRFTNVKTCATFNEPVNYTIKEYTR